MKTYSLAEVAEQLCGDSMARPELWLTRQIATGRFTARRVGRHWRMTQADIDHALAIMANRANPTPTPTPTPEVPATSTKSPQIERPTAASMRRRLAVAK